GGRPRAEPGSDAEDPVARLERERDELLDALHDTDWNISRAAARLGLPRNTVRYRMAKHHLMPEAARPAEARRPVSAPRPAAPPRPGPRRAPPAARPARRTGGDHAPQPALGAAAPHVPARGAQRAVGSRALARHHPRARGHGREGTDLRRARGGPEPDRARG